MAIAFTIVALAVLVCVFATIWLHMYYRRKSGFDTFDVWEFSILEHRVSKLEKEVDKAKGGNQ